MSDICGYTRTGPTGIEWICIKEPHDKVYRRHSKGRRGELIFSNNPSTEHHHMVNRWPNRKKENDYDHEGSEASSSTEEA